MNRLRDAQCRSRAGRTAGIVRLGALLALGTGLLAACGGGSGDAADGDRLAALPLDPASVTVSGISAGGYMAVQFHVAHSALVEGVGVLAAGPYFCAENSLRLALGRCMQGDEPIAVDELVSLTSRLALDEDRIDPIANLADDRVWIFHGDADPVVARPVVDALQAYYELLVDPRGVARVELPGAGHTFPAAAGDLQACGKTDTPFIGSCGIDGARQLLEHLYGPFQPKAAPRPGELRQFPQSGYARAAAADGFAERGWLYVPQACSGSGKQGRCRLHVAFHGCKQGSSYVDDAFVRRAGYLAAADAGNVVVLFPQVQPSFQPLNPNGCWDWWGYGSAEYATRRGPQIVAVKAMVDDLLGRD